VNQQHVYLPRSLACPRKHSPSQSDYGSTIPYREKFRLLVLSAAINLKRGKLRHSCRCDKGNKFSGRDSTSWKELRPANVVSPATVRSELGVFQSTGVESTANCISRDEGNVLACAEGCRNVDDTIYRDLWRAGAFLFDGRLLSVDLLGQEKIDNFRGMRQTPKIPAPVHNRHRWSPDHQPPRNPCPERTDSNFIRFVN